ncbi:hypothetical protein CDOMF_0071 [Campylobacter sp. RM16187]|nr:hypothetical protein CDOMF_0071 [Campylobacter sp. RM16187]
MYIYVLYGVIVLAIGYFLVVYFNKNRFFQTVKSKYQLENYINNNSFNSIDKTLKDEIAKNN